MGKILCVCICMSVQDSRFSSRCLIAPDLWRAWWKVLLIMANKVNKGFTPESKGVELKSTAVSVPQYSHEEKTQVRRDSNNHLLKLASILIVILVIAIVVIGVYYAKEVRDNDDDETERDKITLRSTSAPTLPTCLNDKCVRSAAGKITATK